MRYIISLCESESESETNKIEIIYQKPRSNIKFLYRNI